MDSQQDSIDIAKLKRFALGFTENDTLQQLVDEPHPHSSSHISDRNHIVRVVIRNSGNAEQLAGRGIASRTVSKSSSLRVNISLQQPSLAENVNVTNSRKTPSQAVPLKIFQETVPAKMSSAGSGPGDTQPLSQSVFDSIMNKGLSTQATQTIHEADFEMDIEEGAADVTLHEGESGHIDLLSGFGEAAVSNANSEQDDEKSSFKVGESSPLSYNVNLFPESQRFMMNTPATVRKQREAPNLATATPSLPRNPYLSNGGSSSELMPLSQVFKATQAPSSPFVNGPPSGPLSDRPSPDIPIQSRPLRETLSSPSRTPRSLLRREHTDPFAYITMEESQNRREKIIEERRARSMNNINPEDQSDGEFEKEPSFVVRRNRQRRMDEEIDDQLTRISVPVRNKQSPSKRAQTATILPSDSTFPTAGDETQGSTVHVQSGGISEEETEQEDYVVPPTGQSRQAVSSTEEDKENYNGPSKNVPDTTASAHDRLSQALDLRTPPTEDDPPQHDQIINVRDSQLSPSQGCNAAEMRQSQQSQGDEERVESSLAKTVIHCSLPKEHALMQDEQSHEVPQLSPSRRVHSRSMSVASVESSTDPAQSQASQNAKFSPKNITLEKPSSSSMPSCVTDTPTNKAIDDIVPETSIPEFSPNRFRHHAFIDAALSSQAAIQEDDDLPTPPHHQRNWDGSKQVHSGDHDLREKPERSAKILSSPSGKSRRALTEIASDASPKVGTDIYDIDFDIVNADDREFNSIVNFSPLPPKKKRRGNDGHSLIQSDPITPRPESRRVDHLVVQNKTEQTSIQHSEPAFETSIVQRKRSKPSRRAEILWEIDTSPQHATSKAITSQRSRTSRYSETRPAQIKKTARTSVFQSVVVHNHRSAIPATLESSDPIQTSTTSLDPGVGFQISSSNTRRTQFHQARETSSGVHNSPPREEIRAPNQVLAPWNGTPRAHYPAKCVGITGSNGQQRYVVKFVDSGFVEVPISSVKRLELRVGDRVKVEWPNVPKGPYMIRGFSGQLSVEELSKKDEYGSLPVTDIYGYSKVTLVANKRKSFPNGGGNDSERTIEVFISTIYLDMNQWNQLKDRQFTFDSKIDQATARRQTPVDHPSNPTTPTSRLSRSTVLIRKGIFVGMVFAVSYMEQDDTKKSLVTKLITENGGRILRDGFDELFDFPSSIPAATPSKSPASILTIDVSHFRLASGSESIGFACLIADKHSRRAKYMQALALNIPCLSGRWIEDCVRQNRILDWETYLLPAGESMYLYGAVKSRVMTISPADTARLGETISKRAKLLDGQSVLLVMGRGKVEERRKAYVFLTYALGASRVERVLDLSAAKAALEERKGGHKNEPGWDWIYVDDNEEAAAKALILGKTNNGAAGKLMARVGRKRKRSSMLVESISQNDMNRLEKKVRIIGNEFVCQSLILGRLFEEPS